MTKFNTHTNAEQEVVEHKDATTNFEGGLAFNLEPLARLYTRVAACLVSEPKFYSKMTDNLEEEIIEVGGKKIKNIKIVNIGTDNDMEILKDIQEVAKTDPEFILKLAVYCRNQLYLRSVSILLLVEAANIVACKPFVRKAAPSIIKRADELREALAYQISRFGEPVPNSLKKGLAKALENFDEYQFEKYSGGQGKIKFANLFRMVHPKPKDKAREALYNYLIYSNDHKNVMKERMKYLPILAAKEKLMECKELDDKAKKIAKEAHATWEVFISKFGSNKDTWRYIAPELPVMALLRNLRNLLDNDVSLSLFIDKLTDEETILNSKQLPFRWFSAYRELEGNKNINTSKVLDALQDAIEISVKNVPKLEGVTFSTADNSGSMDSNVSERSKVKMKDIANVMQAILAATSDNVVTSVFAEHFKVVNVSKRDGIITNMMKFSKTDVGYSTDAYKAIRYLTDNKIKVDRIVIFSDMQCYDSVGRIYGTEQSLVAEFKKYKRSVNSKVRLYSIDLAGMGTAQFPQDEPNVVMIAGWSDKIFDFILAFEEDKKQVIERIRNYGLSLKPDQRDLVKKVKVVKKDVKNKVGKGKK